jgi:prepilin-type N-terminal cleavage/methylation domain-containing protein
MSMRGITLIELLCAIGIMALLAASSAYVSIGSFERMQAGMQTTVTDVLERSSYIAELHHASSTTAN